MKTSLRFFAALLTLAFATVPARAAAIKGDVLVVSGNENKIELTSGVAKVIRPRGPDTLSVLNFATFPPTVDHLTNVPNTVIGPPSNIAISPDGTLALVANSVKVDEFAGPGYSPNNEIHAVDISIHPPRVIEHLFTRGRQPSGISFTPDGKYALVANRADGSITLLQISNSSPRMTVVNTIPVCKPEEEISDIAISPDGRLALASVKAGGYLAVLELRNGVVRVRERKVSVFGQPYRVVITPDGELAVTAGSGFGNGYDNDALTIIQLGGGEIRATEHITIGVGPESLEISPDGKMLAVVVMNGSNLAANNPNRSGSGGLEIFVREKQTFTRKQQLETGAIPEGVAFTGDGKYLVVQCHPARELWLFEVKGKKVKDTGERVKVPGMPSGLRAATPR